MRDQWPAAEDGVLFSPDGKTYFELLVIGLKKHNCGSETYLTVYDPHHNRTGEISLVKGALRVKFDSGEVIFHKTDNYFPRMINIVSLPEQLTLQLLPDNNPLLFRAETGMQILYTGASYSKVLYSPDGEQFFQIESPDYSGTDEEHSFTVRCPQIDFDCKLVRSKGQVTLGGENLAREKNYPGTVQLVRLPIKRIPVQLYQYAPNGFLYVSRDKHEAIARRCNSQKFFCGPLNGLQKIEVYKYASYGFGQTIELETDHDNFYLTFSAGGTDNTFMGKVCQWLDPAQYEIVESESQVVLQELSLIEPTFESIQAALDMVKDHRNLTEYRAALIYLIAHRAQLKEEVRFSLPSGIGSDSDWTKVRESTQARCSCCERLRAIVPAPIRMRLMRISKGARRRNNRRPVGCS